MNQQTIRGYFGHHKCGTMWLWHILRVACAVGGWKVGHHHHESLFEGEILEFRERNWFDFWIYTDADFNYVRNLDCVGFHVVRDPRDIIVSAYFSHLKSHEEEHFPRLKYYRPYLRTLSKEDGILAEMEFCQIFVSQMLMWDYNTPNIMQLKFEDLIKDDVGLLGECARFVGLVPNALPAEKFAEIVSVFSFEQLSGGRRPGVENENHHYRRGIPGDWRNHFTPKCIDYFKRLYNPVLLKLGYETDDNWR
jgi:hypothetical protein